MVPLNNWRQPFIYNLYVKVAYYIYSDVAFFSPASLIIIVAKLVDFGASLVRFAADEREGIIR
jgi:hypothetical protein